MVRGLAEEGHEHARERFLQRQSVLFQLARGLPVMLGEHASFPPEQRQSASFQEV